ncbi:Serine/threonine-protein kinase 4 [Characodon lateralis]|uniref:Serine/threonine-protein kinase 4 n=1 Tax=Characodon lateralis TaxID=208331 RepID=A0ABU7DC28_9TELE|nr:Serine/threonine-protein kinase 4 [Characodon lateralis]
MGNLLGNDKGGTVPDHRTTTEQKTVSTWSVEELRVRLSSLDPQMEQEIGEIHQRYQAKRQPILDAIAAKKRLQQNF